MNQRSKYLGQRVTSFRSYRQDTGRQTDGLTHTHTHTHIGSDW